MGSYTKIPGIRRGKGNTRIEILHTKGAIPKFIKQIQQGSNNATVAVKSFAEQITAEMIGIVAANKKPNTSKQGRPTIEDTLAVEGYGGGASQLTIYGVLNAKEMDKVVPYWRLINNGGTIPVHFVPGGFEDGKSQPGAGGGVFEYKDHSSMGMQIKPGTIVSGMHFVERGVVFAKRAFPTFMKSTI